jgi:predicted ATPase
MRGTLAPYEAIVRGYAPKRRGARLDSSKRSSATCHWLRLMAALSAASVVALQPNGLIPRTLRRLRQAIAGLVTKSLVTVETNHTGTLYRLFDTTRAYVLTKMAESGEREIIAQRHAIYCHESLERVEIDSLICSKTVAPWRAEGM